LTAVPRIEGVELPQEVRDKIERTVDHLHSEFEGQFDRDQVSGLVHDSASRLAANSTVSDNIPLLAYRFARERLKAIARRHGAEGSCDVVFVSLSGGGRGQIAAALTASLSDRHVSVHSAGTAAFGEIDPGVRLVLGEIGIDADEPFARPVTEEIIQGADVIVTMGHSVGAITIPADVRHEDWRIGDPIGAPIDEIRRVRADIEYRVRALLDSLDVPVSSSVAAQAGE
jgi:protein-tyrosine-phosphatase